ncbi:MAG: hypothetical protein H6577_19075 [Lewinellaceae bacterium]|nr:hypothetical protein [Saprospiraceae bacterium]MCB9340228.1 hypothetical protein [Lewinellaceae bacterium]
MNIVAVFVWVFYAYLIVGLLFAAWFVAKGVNTVDGGMKHTSWGVRLLLFPGSVLLWAVLLKKYLKAKSLDN